LKAAAFNLFLSKLTHKRPQLGIPMPENGIGVQYLRANRPRWVFPFQFLAGLTFHRKEEGGLFCRWEHE
jgi:hypothetical protein